MGRWGRKGGNRPEAAQQTQKQPFPLSFIVCSKARMICVPFLSVFYAKKTMNVVELSDKV